MGIAGVEGNGQSELIEAVMGMRPVERGRIVLDGTDITGRHTRAIREAGIGYIPEDRHRHGILLESPLWENRVLGHQTRRPNAKGMWIDRSGARADTRRIVDAYDVRTPGVDVLADALSGGNQQKLIVGREMSGERRSSWPPTPPGAWTSAPRPRSGTTCAPRAPRVWRCCWSPPTSTS